MEKSFGIISEGVTDQITLENILFGFLGNKNLPITRLQPKEDEPGNWDKVFKYCESPEFKSAFAYLDYLIIQIDTDFMERGEVPSRFKIEVKDCSVEEIIMAFREKLIELIGIKFYKNYEEQIIFAISVSEIECWFLPIFFENQKKKAGKTKNCIGTLNTVLPQQVGFFIDDKKTEYYEALAKPFRKKKQLLKFSKQNPSFQSFIVELKNKVK